MGFWWGHKDLNADSAHLVNLQINTTGSETSNRSQRELKIEDCIMPSFPEGWEHGPTAGSGAGGIHPGSGMLSVLIHGSTSEHQGPLLCRWPSTGAGSQRCVGVSLLGRYSEASWAWNHRIV